ncbi:hypothetical protein HAX54_032035, partial [Datura stramonium]|nr:hypothetical protein [Datura stramonium]
MACTIRKRDEERRKAKEREEIVKNSKGAIPTDQTHASQVDNSGMVSDLPLHTDTSLQVPNGAKENVPINPNGSNPQNPKEKGPQNPNEIAPKNPKKRMYVANTSTSVVLVVANTSPLPHGSPATIGTVSEPLPHGFPISLLVVGVIGGKVDGQEDGPRGLVGCQEKPIETFSTSHSHLNTSEKRKAAQKKKVELEATLIASHHDMDSPQNFVKEMTSNIITSDIQTP